MRQTRLPAALPWRRGVAMEAGDAAGQARARPEGAPQPLGAAGREVRALDPRQPGECLIRPDPRGGRGRRPPPGPRSDWVPPEPPPPGQGPPRDPPPERPAPLRLLNTLTGQEHVTEGGGVPLRQALPWNAHAGGYAWRCGGAPFDPQRPPPPRDPLPVLLYFADDFEEL